jgi:hypothetical protein
MDYKCCTKCGLEKPLDEFYKRSDTKDGYRKSCKLCDSTRITNKRKENINSFKEYQKKYRENNLNKIKKYKEQWVKDNPNYYSEINKNWYLNNKNKKMDYERQRKLNDPLYKLTKNIRTMIGASFRTNGYTKNSKTNDILGCSFEEFKNHLESLFEPWMTWDNKGNWDGEPTKLNESWDIDHIIPIATAKTEDDIIKLNHYTNLQPLCSFYNRKIKKDKLL